MVQETTILVDMLNHNAARRACWS